MKRDLIAVIWSLLVTGAISKEKRSTGTGTEMGCRKKGLYPDGHRYQQLEDRPGGFERQRRFCDKKRK